MPPLRFAAAVAFLSVVGSASCRREGAPAEAAPSLRDEARVVMERECGACHIRGYPTALPAALAVFDLTEAEWAARMSERQLQRASDRIVEGAALMFDPQDVRNAGLEPPPPPSPREVALVQAYLRQELTARAVRGKLGP